MTESASTTREAVIAFLREEAPYELERLRSISQLVAARAAATSEPPDLVPVPVPHPNWVRRLGSLAS